MSKFPNILSTVGLCMWENLWVIASLVLICIVPISYGAFIFASYLFIVQAVLSIFCWSSFFKWFDHFSLCHFFLFISITIIMVAIILSWICHSLAAIYQKIILLTNLATSVKPVLSCRQWERPKWPLKMGDCLRQVNFCDLIWRVFESGCLINNDH